MSGRPPVVAVLGLGEAGSVIAADLAAAGAVVRGFDPRVRPGPGVTACAGDADACRGAAVVVSLTCAHEAEEALLAALPGIGPGAIYADLNTASAEAKVHLARLAAGRRGPVHRRRADVAGARQRAAHPDARLRPGGRAVRPRVRRARRGRGRAARATRRGGRAQTGAERLLQGPRRGGHRGAACGQGRRVRTVAAGQHPPRTGERVGRHARPAGAGQRAARGAAHRRDGRGGGAVAPARRAAPGSRRERAVAAATGGRAGRPRTDRNRCFTLPPAPRRPPAR